MKQNIPMYKHEYNGLWTEWKRLNFVLETYHDAINDINAQALGFSVIMTCYKYWFQTDFTAPYHINISFQKTGFCKIYNKKRHNVAPRCEFYISNIYQR